MLFSYNKLIELANLKATPEEVSSAITSIGFEVEGIENFSKVEGIKFGKVLELSKNPNDNKLTVVKIMFDNGNKIIQTTATNLKLNDVVIAFVPGSSNGEFTFSSKELKGVLSEGMLSNINEFGIKKDLLPEYMYEGIGTFNEINDLSIDPIEYLGLNDFIIEVSVLSNRSDVNSYLIMARELSSYFETEVNFNFEDLKVSGKTKNSFSFKEHELSKISLVETSENISLNMKQKMMIIKSGITLNKNDMINVSNLIFILSGQPTHVYDSEILNSKILEVKKINGKANILGNKIVEFNNSQVIFDGKEAVSVAGIVGIQKFSVSDKTKKYLFEFGIFNNYEVRKTSKMIKTNTNSGNQSGKKLGLGTKEIAIKILSILLKGNHSTVFYNYKNKPKKTFFIKYEYLNKIAGEDFRKNKKFPDLIKKLTKLGFIFEENNKVFVPKYRHDVETTQDIIEELFRFYGLDNFNEEIYITNPSKIFVRDNTKEKFVQNGYQEVSTYTLVTKKQSEFNPFNFEKTIFLETYTSKLRESIRNSQIHSVLEIMKYNEKQKQPNFSIVSEGMINKEKNSIAIASNEKSFFEIKQDIENIIKKRLTFVRIEKDYYFNKYNSAWIYFKKTKIGFIGQLHPILNLGKSLVAELLIENLSKNKIKYKDEIQEPLKSFDETFEMKIHDDSMKFVIEKYNINEFESIKIIDSFKNNELKKVTFRFIYKNNSKKLSK